MCVFSMCECGVYVCVSVVYVCVCTRVCMSVCAFEGVCTHKCEYMWYVCVCACGMCLCVSGYVLRVYECGM